MEVCVITGGGGGSGMGLEAAKCMDRRKIIVLAGRTEAKLERGAQQLREHGFTAYTKACDVSDKQSVRELARFADSLGSIRNVIHAAGLSPAMGTPEQIIRVNALGTLHVNHAFAKVMERGSVIVDVASNSAYELPAFLVPAKTFRRAEKAPERFVRRLVRISGLVPGSYYQSGLAYVLSKSFVIWHSSKCAFLYGKSGIRFCSLSPGLIDTEMGALEKEKGMMMLRATAELRMGRPEELGYALATAADERNGFLAGTDVLCDGGATAKRKRFLF